MEISLGKEAGMLRVGHGEVFQAKEFSRSPRRLLQAGVAYVGGYQGAPVSHLLDVLVQSKDYLAELGVHVEACSNEASAAAMLGASIHYPVRGAVTWKSIVGTNVAADALSNLASPGVRGGALIVVGEDYGEGASVIQERTYAYAQKSSLLLFDPRPDLGHMVRHCRAGVRAFGGVEHAGDAAVAYPCLPSAWPASSAATTSRPRCPPATHWPSPPQFDYGKLAHPPVTYRQEKLKSAERLPVARREVVARGLNERIGGRTRRSRARSFREASTTR